MKNIIIFFFALTLFAACDLNKLEPAQTKSFIKYFGDTGNSYGEDLLKLTDGYLLLGNVYEGSTHRYSVLIKTDLNGNTLWTQTHDGIEGRALAQSPDGYFIVGDGINGTNSTMMLIKTNLQGTQISAIAPLGNDGESYHGTAITISSANEVVVSGYIESEIDADEFFIYGYPTDLSESTWDDISKQSRNNVITSRRLHEVDSEELGNPFFVSTFLENTGANENLQVFSFKRDALSPGPSPPLLEDFNLSGEIGDFVINSNGQALIQTVNNSGTGIVFVQSNQDFSYQEPVIITPDDGFNYTAHSLVKSRNDGSYVIIGSSNNNGSTARQDTDYFVKKVGYEGSELSNGFTLMFGGEGSETAKKIIQADDNGYVFIGTLENTNDVDFIVLVKITKDGQLIN